MSIGGISKEERERQLAISNRKDYFYDELLANVLIAGGALDKKRLKEMTFEEVTHMLISNGIELIIDARTVYKRQINDLDNRRRYCPVEE